MLISPTLKKVLSNIKSTASEVVTVVTVVTENTHVDIAKSCDDMSLSPPETTPDVATQGSEDASLAGAATSATPATPPKHDVPTFHALFSPRGSSPTVAITTTHGQYPQPLARDVAHLGPILSACPVCGAMQYWHNHATDVWECWECVPPPTPRGKQNL